YNRGIGEIKGRKVNITIDSLEEIVGSKIYAKGNFTRNLNISKGIIGDFTIIKYEKGKKDLTSYLYNLRKDLYDKIQSKLGARKAGIISSVAYGYDDNIDNYDREKMKYYGISHAICVSGLHITMVYSIALLLGSNLLGMIVSFFYMLFSGAKEAAIRSYIMIVISNLAIKFKRQYNMMAALSLAGIVILIVKPYCLFSIGFILSFVNIVGIYFFNKKINRVFYKIPSKIRQVVAITLSTQIFILPITMMYFNEFCANSIIGNLLIIPFINIIIILGNLLILFLKIPIVFNYILFVSKYIIILMDNIMNFFDKITIDIFYIYYGAAYFYIAMLITYYFYKNGYKQFIYYPIIVFIYVLIMVYSPVVNIKYYNEGAMVISFRGKRALIQYNEEEDNDKLKKITLCEKMLNNDFKKFLIKDGVYIKRSGENYILKTKKEQCLLKINYDKINYNYEIIDFTKGDIEDVWIVKDIIISRR
ncbi:MAG: ComEC/Rec2 family competence protein, partial [Clostridium sp.]